MNTTSKAVTATSPLEQSEANELAVPKLNEAEWPLLPTETEIYILPDGQVVVADMPIELNEAISKLGNVVTSCP